MDTKNVNSKVELSTGQWLLIVIFFLVLITMGISAGISSDESNSQGIALTNNGVQVVDNENFELLESTSERQDNGTYIIKGKIKQKEEKSFEGIAISFMMYDNNNKEVRSTTYNLSNYLGNGVWEFEAFGNDADKIATSYKIDYVYGY